MFFFLLLFRIFSKIGDPPERVRPKESTPSVAPNTLGTDPPARKSRIPESARLARSERAAVLVDTETGSGIQHENLRKGETDAD
jgi:hypothetical protein